MRIADLGEKSVRYLSLLIVFMFGILSIIATSGNGDNGDDEEDLNNLLSGEYQIHKVEYEGFSFIVEQYDGTADGVGTFNLGFGSFEYSIASDRSLSITFPSDPTIEPEYGVVSSDGNLAIITDAQLVDPNNQNDVEILLLVRKSTDTAMTLSRASGDYIISQLGINASGLYASQVQISIYSDGTGIWEILSHSQPGEAGLSGVLSVSVSVDGTLIVDNGSGPDTGIISADADVFVLTDSDQGDADSESIFAVGVRKSTSAPVLSGAFQTHFIGYDGSNAYPTGPQFAARWSVAEDDVSFILEATCIIDSRGTSSGTIVDIPHTPVLSDGTFTANFTDLSILSPDGSFFALVETDTISDTEIKIGLAIK